MEFYNFIQMIEEHVILPIIIAFGAAILIICKHFFDKISKSIVAKNEISEMQKQVSIRNELMNTIQEAVKTAVASNMQTANAMKSGGRKLDEDQIKELNDNAMKLIIGYLPPSLTEEGGLLLEYIGSREKLDNMIYAMIEKTVYDYKINTVNKQDTITVAEDTNNDECATSTLEDEESVDDTAGEETSEVLGDDHECTVDCIDIHSTRKRRSTPVLF